MENQRNKYNLYNAPPPECLPLLDEFKQTVCWQHTQDGILPGAYQSRTCNLDVFGYCAKRNLLALQIRIAQRELFEPWAVTKRVYLVVGKRSRDGFLYAYTCNSAFSSAPKNLSPAEAVDWALTKAFGVESLKYVDMREDLAFSHILNIPNRARLLTSTNDNGVSVVCVNDHLVEVFGGLYHQDATAFYTNGFASVDKTRDLGEFLSSNGRARLYAAEIQDRLWWQELTSEIGGIKSEY